MMTGLSLSLCVRDILNDIYTIDQVDMVVTGTYIRYAHDLDRVVENYGKHYWQKDPKAARNILMALLLQGKIDQPRVRGEEGPNLQNGHWIYSDSDQAKQIKLEKIQKILAEVV